MSILLQGISIAVICSAFILIAWRVLGNAGVKLPRRIGKGIYSEAYIPGNRECAKVFAYSMLFRLFVIGAGFVIYCIFTENGNTIRPGQIIEIWKKWDADHYIRVSNSYTFYTENGDYTTLVFFPLYSWLLKFTKLIFRKEVLAGLVTSALCSSAGCVFMYKLACIDYKRTAAQKVVILMCVFPFAFFQSGVMTESVFFMTSSMTLYYIRKHNWMAAGIAGMFCALSRSAGVFLILPATVEFAEEYRIFDNLKDIRPKLMLIAKKWSWLLLLPIGTCIYLYINYRVTGDALYFLKMEKKYWYQTSQPFFKTVATLWNVTKGGYSVSTVVSSFLPGLVILLSMYALLLYGIPKHKSMYSSWLWIYLIINTTMSWPLSICRYLSCAAPIFLYLGEICDKNKKLNTAFTVGFSILFGIYLTGYLMGKQIM